MLEICVVIPAVKQSVIDTVENLNLQELRPGRIIVVNNGLDKITLESLGKVRNLEIIGSGDNLGSAGGYKLGIGKAVRDGFNFIFTSDDDTEYSYNALKVLLDSIIKIQEAGAVRCAWEDYSGDTEEVQSSVWTGVLMKREAVEKTGLPDDRFFLYGDDVEFFLRMRKLGFKIFIIPDARYLRRSKGLKGVKQVYSEPFRLYYALRNEVYIHLKYDKKKVIRPIGFFLKRIPYLTKEQFIAGLEGIVHGFFGILGKNSKYLPSL